MPPFKAKLICSCGGKLNIVTSSKNVFDVVTKNFYDFHTGPDHKTTDLLKAKCVSMEQLVNWGSDMVDE